MRSLPGLLCLLFFTICTNATTIKGRITDKHGEPVGFATIAQTGTTNGTSANAAGEYLLEVEEGRQTIECSLMGYQTQTKTIQVGRETISLDFVLEEQHYNIDEVIVTNGEDPAYEMMRQVIARRKQHADQIQTFSADIYLKGMLRTRSMPKKIFGFSITDSMKTEMGLDSSGSGIIYLLEELSQYQYKAPDKEYNRVISVRESGDPKGLGFATMPPITNIYDNNIKILEGLNERGFISPANNNAFLYYRFKFLGNYIENDKLISKIQVIPKRKFEPLFSGEVYVVENDWVFKAVNLTLTTTSQMNQLDTLRLEQSYTNLERDIWVIQSQVLYPTIRILGVDIAGNFITVYQHQKVNQPLQEQNQPRNIIASYESDANKRSSDYWDTLRPIPLDSAEHYDFQKKDSLYIIDKQKQDSLTDKPEYRYSLSHFFLSGPYIKVKKNTWSLNPLINMVAYNTVEGVYVSPTISWSHRFRKGNRLLATLSNRYGFSSGQYYYLAQLQYITTDTTISDRFWRLNLQGGNYIYQLNEKNPISPFLNELYTLLSGNNYMKLYAATGIRFKTDRHWGNGLATSIGLLWEDRNALFNTTQYTFTKRDEVHITPNQPAGIPAFEDHRAMVIDALIRYQPGWKYVQYPQYKMAIRGKAPIFTLRYTKGIPGVFNSKTDFDRWSLSIRHQLNMRLLGNIDYMLSTGGFLNKNYTGIPDRNHIYGNQTILANPFGSFQLAPYYRFTNTADIYGTVNATWHLGGLLSNKIPLFRRLNWFFIAGTNTLYINRKDYYSEVFFGLENIGYKLVRFGELQFVLGYESGRTQPDFGVRLGLGPIVDRLLGISKTGDTNR